MKTATYQKITLFFIFFFGASLMVFALINGGAFAANIRYSILLNSPFVDEDLRTSNIVDIASSSGSIANVPPPAEGEELTLIIPKIEVEAPVVIASENSNKGILSALEEGVGLYPDSVSPGHEGRSIILGHSSRATWYRGDYAHVFALLPKLDVYDEFYIVSGDTKLVYQVFARQILSKADANALFATPTQGSEVNLITCYPIGSASKRTVIQAKLMRSERL